MKAESTFQTGIPTFRHDHLLIVFIATIFTTSNNSKIASAAAAKISEALRASLMTHPPHRAALDARIVTSVVAHLKLLRRQGRREGGREEKFGSVAKITSPSPSLLCSCLCRWRRCVWRSQPQPEPIASGFTSPSPIIPPSPLSPPHPLIRSFDDEVVVVEG
jgi:hypothetical protein